MSAFSAEQESIHPKLQSAFIQNRVFTDYAFAPPTMRGFLIETEQVRRLMIITTPPKKRSLLVRGLLALDLYFSSGTEFADIAPTFARSREAIRRAVRYNITPRIWQSAPAETQAKYPLEDIRHARKTYPPEYLLLIKDGLGNRIMALMEEENSLDHLIQESGIEKWSLVKRLRMLRDLGIAIPKIPRSLIENKVLVRDLKDITKNDEEVQALLDNLPSSISIQQSHSGEIYLGSVVNTARSIGYHVWGNNAHEFMEVAAEAVPLSPPLPRGGQKIGRKIYPLQYRFFVKWHEHRVKKALQAAKRLEQYLINPVKQISGDTTRKTPSTLKIAKRDGIYAVGRILSTRFGITPASALAKSIRQSLAENGYPGNLYLYRKTLLLETGDEAILEDYLKENFRLVPKFPAK